MKQKIKDLSLKDFSELVGSNVIDLPKETREEFKKYDFRYRELTTEERDRAILKMIKKIISTKLPVSGPKYKKKWKSGWTENLKNFKESNYNIKSLVPKFIKSHQPIRLKDDFAMPVSPTFELDFYNVFRNYLFRKYLKKPEDIYEFGCGTGFNLVELAKLYPEKNLWGGDWVIPSKKLVDLIAKVYGFKMKGFIFDFFKPDRKFKLRPNSSVLLIGALEQTGTNFSSFLNYLISQKPKIVVHVDSMNELYDSKNLADFLALWHDKQRNYLYNYLTMLKKLELKGEVKILKIHKVPCGGKLHDGYSYDIWTTQL